MNTPDDPFFPPQTDAEPSDSTIMSKELLSSVRAALIKELTKTGVTEEEAATKADEAINSIGDDTPKPLHFAQKLYQTVVQDLDRSALHHAQKDARISKEFDSACAQLLSVIANADYEPAPEVVMRLLSNAGPASASLASAPVLSLAQTLSEPAQAYVCVSLLATICGNELLTKFMCESLAEVAPQGAHNLLITLHDQLED